MKTSAYIEWAKSRATVRYNLARSGVPSCPLELLAPQEEDRAISGENLEGWLPLLERIAARYGASSNQVVLAHGCSMANHLACATILERDDEVLVESPSYEPLHALPVYLGAKVRFFERRREEGYRMDPEAIRAELTPRTRLVILTNLHNPTGALAEGRDLAELGRLAEERGFHVLVDEVYLEFLYAAGERTAARLSPQFVTTRSLTKAYGLDGLRAGWILASPDLAERMRRLNDLFSILTAHPTERLAARAIDRADAIYSRVRGQLERNRLLVDAFINSVERLSWVSPPAGTIGWVRLEGGSVDRLVERLEADFETTVVPGRFFGAPDHFRIGFSMETDLLQAGLQRLGKALD